MATILASFSDIITSNKVCERAASIIGGSADLDAEDIQRMIGVNAINGSVIEIYALSPRPELAISVANAIAEAFIKEVTSSTKNDSVQILDAAVDYSLYSNGSEDILLRRGIFALIGLAGSSIYIVYTELISKKLRTIVQCVEDNEEEILGIIPYINS
jgi:capsular polysaccharide biosynthesis protein